ncbi:MAG: sulfotransferase [Pseudomonadota bacterium]
MQSARAWFEKGERLRGEGNTPGAFDAYRKSLKLNPNVAAPWVGLARLLDGNQQPKEALECLKRAADAEPHNLVASIKLAQSFLGIGQVENAKQEYNRALSIDDRSPDAYFGLGRLHEDAGAPEEAAEAYRAALKLKPCHAEALANLLGLGRYVDVSDELAAAQSNINDIDDPAAALIGFGIAKELDRRGEFDTAAKVLISANGARQREAGLFNREHFDQRIQTLIDVFSESFFKDRLGWGHSSNMPVFIVGLPRSGTTLTEQIIGSHPTCFGAGELGVLADLSTGTPDRLGRAEPPWPKSAPELSEKQVSDIGREYTDELRNIADSSVRYVVDKQPLNFWQLGLVALALPNARIIHCVRDIRDTGLSIFSQNFHVDQRWSADMEDIGYYWRGYRRLMQHWTLVSRLKIIDVHYEDTVTDVETQACNLLQFLDLPWDDRVLLFHENDRAVQTPSRWQVRQPVYSSSKAKWRNYESLIEPLAEQAGVTV